MENKTDPLTPCRLPNFIINPLRPIRQLFVPSQPHHLDLSSLTYLITIAFEHTTRPFPLNPKIRQDARWEGKVDWWESWTQGSRWKDSKIPQRKSWIAGQSSRIWHEWSPSPGWTQEAKSRRHSKLKSDRPYHQRAQRTLGSTRPASQLVLSLHSSLDASW